jgi:hypothetical protein
VTTGVEITRERMVRMLMLNIEQARDMVGDGGVGHVFHTVDHTLFIVEGDDGELRLGSPLSAKIVKSCRSAEVLRRYWNSRLTQDQIEAGCGIVCSLRGDALAAYIEKQEMLIGVLTTTHAVDGEVAIRAM